MNASPHLGHALEFVQGDVRVRFERLNGKKVFFNIGSDEYGIKIYQKAKELDIPVEDYVEKNTLLFKDLLKQLDITPSRFIRTTDDDHKNAVHHMWNKCKENGYIYQKTYKGLYCVGCELFVDDNDLVDGVCPHHPTMQVEEVEEENYFFKMSSFQNRILEHYKQNPNFVIPKTRMNEITNFVSSGVKDISISRERRRLDWGIEVPEDPTQTIYVWFDALTNYLTTIGWPNGDWKSWWPVVQIAGKDNLRQQSLIWQSMLAAAGVEFSKQIFIHGFITVDGKKMSKTLGNVIDPLKLIEEYGSDVFRFFCMRAINSFDDTDLSLDSVEVVYKADLKNGIGNLTSRIMKMAETNLSEPISVDEEIDFDKDYIDNIRSFNYRAALEIVMEMVHILDKRVEDIKPYTLVKQDKEKGDEEIRFLVRGLRRLNKHIRPIMPKSFAIIDAAISENKLNTVLFP